MARSDVVTARAIQNVRRVTEVRETIGSQSTSNSVWVTLTSITGAGWIYVIQAESTNTPATFRLTIDGGTPVTITYSGVLPRSISATTVQIALPITNVRFDSSVLVEYQTSNATPLTGTARIIWGVR